MEIDQTDRYKLFSNKVEAKACATKTWLPGDEIVSLAGIFVALTAEEEQLLSSRDFSIMYSTKRHRYGLFLGPARFVNHDCNPNVAVKRHFDLYRVQLNYN